MESHTQWDSPPAVADIRWDGTRARLRTWCMIASDIHPGQYPKIINSRAYDSLRSTPKKLPHALMIQVEAHTVTEPGTDATREERAAYQRDRVNRTFYQRPDAVEKAAVFIADIRGRLWLAEKIRGRDGIAEWYWEMDAEDFPGGPVPVTLQSAALAIGALGWGLSVTINGKPYSAEDLLRRKSGLFAPVPPAGCLPRRPRAVVADASASPAGAGSVTVFSATGAGSVISSAGPAGSAGSGEAGSGPGGL